MKQLSRSIPAVMAKSFERKYIALGRIVTHWREIVGPDYAECSQPATIHYQKAKVAGEKSRATLEIAAGSAHCATLIYRKDVILQTIEAFFGERWITDIKFVHVEPKRAGKPPKRTKNLTDDEKNRLSHLLETVGDPDLRERLARLGTSIIQDRRP